MTKEEIIAAIRECAEKLGHAPSLPELRANISISHRTMRKSFGSYSRALEACGLERQGAGFQLAMKPLFMEWAGLVRRLGKVPTILDYEEHSRYSVRPLITRFGSWTRVPLGLQQYAQREGIQDEWKDVLNVILAHQENGGRRNKTSTQTKHSNASPRILTDRPTYGPPLRASALNCAPTNEMGVVFLFGTLAWSLGFSVTHLQSAFPDCEALRQVEYGKWQRIRIEFEYESRNFLLHMHDPKGCDLIVCWSHNWPECPVEVLELKSLVARQDSTC
jgi:hypothetical protein